MVAIGVGAIHFFGGERENRVEQADLWIVNRELRGVDADGEAAGAGGDVVAREGALAAFVELARRGEGERMGGDHGAGLERGERGSMALVRSLELAIAHLEVRRLVPSFAAALDPVGGPVAAFRRVTLAAGRVTCRRGSHRLAVRCSIRRR